MNFRRTDLSVRERAADLLAQLTPDERLAMLHQAMPAIERLGVAESRTGAEALHGVAWLGTATVFPQPVGMAATWDPELVEAIGEVAATELRAKRAENPLVSLNVWAPVVNTLRHPQWGRNEEGYSEDPHLTGQLGCAYAQGLRGRHERVWKTVPALKHFLAYSNETDRSATSSEMSLRTLHEEELPAFRPAIEQQTAGSMMLAYNRVNGTPAHTQPELVAEARSWTDGSLAIVSDAGAPTFMVTIQGAQPDGVHAAAALVRSGMDSFTDNDADAGPRSPTSPPRSSRDCSAATTSIGRRHASSRCASAPASSTPTTPTRGSAPAPSMRRTHASSPVKRQDDRSSCSATMPDSSRSPSRSASPWSVRSRTPCSPTGTPARRRTRSASPPACGRDTPTLR
ncbi:glycoside hydrolase family 3 protein [Microbacterium paludicola]|uniref:glycoside hydrolase family 3 protein n=1 Tax=Microbacterium paludicola TaxID=300019 RepID=UPI0021B55D08|nr:glycoside hydrolase family 3 N-terminal domain-containing protein [Microbacterium paludicola]